LRRHILPAAPPLGYAGLLCPVPFSLSFVPFVFSIPEFQNQANLAGVDCSALMLKTEGCANCVRVVFARPPQGPKAFIGCIFSCRTAIAAVFAVFPDSQSSKVWLPIKRLASKRMVASFGSNHC